MVGSELCETVRKPQKLSETAPELNSGAETPNAPEAYYYRGLIITYTILGVPLNGSLKGSIRVTVRAIIGV